MAEPGCQGVTLALGSTLFLNTSIYCLFFLSELTIDCNSHCSFFLTYPLHHSPHDLLKNAVFLIKIWEARLLNAHMISPNSLHDLAPMSPVSGTYNSLNTLCVFMFWHLCNIQLGQSPRKFLCFTCDFSTHSGLSDGSILARISTANSVFHFCSLYQTVSSLRLEAAMLIFKAYLNT